MALLDFGRHDYDDRLYSAAGRVSARHVAKNVQTAVAGPIIGGSVYILFAFVPMLIVVAAVLVMPEAAQRMLEEDPQQLLPTLVRDYMPMWLRVLFSVRCFPR